MPVKKTTSCPAGSSGRRAQPAGSEPAPNMTKPPRKAAASRYRSYRIRRHGEHHRGENQQEQVVDRVPEIEKQLRGARVIQFGLLLIAQCDRR